MKKRLLILGSLREFVQLIETAKARGYYTIVVDGYRDSAGKAHADRSYDIPPGNTEEIALLCQKEQVDGIITSFSDYLFECMVKISAKAGLKCYFSPDRLELYRNKYEMKKMLTQLGIATPRFTTLRSDFTDQELEGFYFPVVVKPLDKYGSRGVLVLDSVEEIRRHFDYVCETSDIKELLVEEYNNGYEFNMMTWVLHGKVQVISIADREKTSIGKHEIPISTRNVYPSKRIEEVYEEAREILQKVADFTGQTSGPLSMQFFWKSGRGIQVCEVAGRFFGYEHELTEYAGDFCIEKLLLDYVYEEEKLDALFAAHNPFFKKQSAVLYFHGKPGMRVCHQEKAKLLAQEPCVLEDWLFYCDGEEIVEHGPNPYVARYYITAENRQELDRLTEHFFEEMSITDEKGQEVLYRNRVGE